MRKYLFIIFLVIAAFQSQAQFDTASIKKNIADAEDSLIALFKRKDWVSYADYMNPMVITLVGGKENFVNVLNESMKALENADVQVMKRGAVLQLLKAGDQYQCVVETFMQMKFNEVLVSGSSYDIGISEDGIKWTFLRITETATPEQLKQILPALSNDLKLPRPQMQQGKTLEAFLTMYQPDYLN